MCAREPRIWLEDQDAVVKGRDEAKGAAWAA